MSASPRNLSPLEVGYFCMATLSALKRAVQTALSDRRVTSTEAARVARLSRDGGVTRAERRYLSSAVRAQVDRFDSGAQSRLHAVGARWTATGNDPRKMSKDANAAYRPSFGKLVVGGIQVGDVKQGLAGDCYFLATAASLARQQPDFLRRSFVANTDGTVSVRFFKKADDGSTQQVWVKVDRDTVQRYGRNVYARGADAHEQWPALLEKAFAKFNGGYEQIGHGGRPDLAAFALTGTQGQYAQTAPQTAADLVASLRAALAARHPVTAQTSPTESSPGMVPNHSYSVLGVVETPEGTRVRVRNPWGYREPGQRGGDGVFELSPEDFKARFTWVVL
jgi:Calpain family cysteine protease